MLNLKHAVMVWNKHLLEMVDRAEGRYMVSELELRCLGVDAPLPD